MAVDVTSRLHEQSELIMTLKSRADFEMERRKEAECKLLNELNKSHDLQQQLLECQQRVSDAENNNRVLRSTLNDLSYELLSKTLNKNTNTDLTRRDTSVQTGDEFRQSKVVSVEASNTRSSNQYLWKFRELKKENNKLLQLTNEMRSIYTQNFKTIQNRLNCLTDLISTVCSSYLKVNQAYHNDDVKWRNERQNLSSHLENEKHLNEEIRIKLNIMEAEKKKIENDINKLKEQRENEMKEFNVNKQIKRLKEELDISKLQTEQMRQDFEAYKIYTKELLDNERRLNKELRKSYH
ncbi:unnamed protein product [Schistosoma margrebowiei]|uniref:Uncharacterized protein n=1 Tax=Schistosoma margrebowiei TaxID=48269 RepID=A0AA85A1R4_9TREM|nr:unnamed protein product [Schistosoma margrebowiei]